MRVFLLIGVIWYGLLGNVFALQSIYLQNFNSSQDFISMDADFAYWDSTNGNYFVNSRDNLEHISWAYSPHFGPASAQKDISIQLDILFENQDWGTYPGVRFYSEQPNNFVTATPIFRIDNAYRNSYVKQIGIYDNAGNKYYTPSIENDVWHRVKIDYSSSSSTANIIVTEVSTSVVIYSQQDVPFVISDFSYLGVGYYGEPDYGRDFSPIRLDNVSISYPDSTSDALNDQTIPSPPTISYETNGLNLTVSWTDVPNATGYTLYYAPYPYTGPESIGSIDMGIDLNFSMYLWNGAAYYIAAAAYNEQGSSGYSNIEYFILEQTSSDPVDVDNDGITGNQGDCNDHDASIYPGATEICGDGIDQDCSGSDAVCGPSSITLSGASWSLSGKYSYCSSSATGSAQFTTSDSLLTRYSYSGQDWHRDCSVSSFPYVDVGISSLGLTDPVSRTEVDTLCTAMMEMEAGPYFDVTVTEFTSTRFKCSYYDRRDGSLEIMNFSR